MGIRSEENSGMDVLEVISSTLEVEIVIGFATVQSPPKWSSSPSPETAANVSLPSKYVKPKVSLS
jgi:hypothetical protein